EILNLVERSLGQLGYAAGSERAMRPPVRPAVKDEPIVEESIEEPPVAEHRVAPAAVVGLPRGILAQGAVTADTKPLELTDGLDDVPSEPVSVDDVDDDSFDLGNSAFDEAAVPDRELKQAPIEVIDIPAPVRPVSAVVVTAEPQRSRIADAPTGVDDDILEIFIEEVSEVLDKIDQWLPQWSAEFGNEEALAEVRRAFHTLKGSGRIVGANVIGELAWSVENM